jgi:hypothetical protein
MLGGKLNIIGIMLTILMTIAMVYVATYLSYSYQVYTSFKETQAIDLFQSVKMLAPVLEEYDDIRTLFLKDLALGYFFTAIGSVSTFISAYRTSNFKYTAKNVSQ